MTEKELRKLKRYQLLELLILQTEQLEELQKKLESFEENQQNQELKMKNLGSIAEASLVINNVFDDAQSAADLYIQVAKNEAEAIINEAHIKANEIIRAANEKVGNTTDFDFEELKDELNKTTTSED